MIKKFISRLQGKNSAISSPQIISANQHHLNQEDISHASLKTIKTLREHGFQAYLVGGSIRDLLIGLHPKDFDVATDATPEQTVKLFRNARTIGRRFKIAHVRFGREVIEVTTFRGHHHNNKHSITAQRNTSGMLLRDNVYGSMEEDAIRRDFTVNALYYCPETHNVYDYTNGIRDLEKRQIQIIGDPEQRYREDPVRMLRAIRLACKLNFTIEQKTAEPIRELKRLLMDIPPARLFDESLKLFGSGHALKVFHALQHHELFDVLFPQTQMILNEEVFFQRFIELALENTDHRIQNNKRTSPSYLFATLLWPAFQSELVSVLSQNNAPPDYQAQHIATDRVISQLQNRISLPRRFSIPMREIWQLQFRLHNRRGKRADSLFKHQRFRAAYDFVLLREACGEDLQGLGQWWTDYQEADQKNRELMAENVSAPTGKRKRRRNKRRRTHKTNDSTNHD